MQIPDTAYFMQNSNQQLQNCRLCPRECSVDRLNGRRGYCGGGELAEIFRYGAHHGEEPPVSGSRGSGTVFFSRCTLSCIYCQNYPCSQEHRGGRYNRDEMAAVFTELYKQGCHNWNLVSPTPWLPMIRDAIEVLKNDGIALPVVYNTSGFERPEVIADFNGLADVFLADLRYSSEESALKGSGFAGYAKIARRALMEMWNIAGPLRLNDDGIAMSGTICRLLIIPGMANEVVDNLEWIAANIGNDVAVSVMAQYTPAYRALELEPWNRKITKNEYDTVFEAVAELGFNEGWMQEFDGITPRELIGFEMEEAVKKED